MADEDEITVEDHKFFLTAVANQKETKPTITPAQKKLINTVDFIVIFFCLFLHS